MFLSQRKQIHMTITFIKELAEKEDITLKFYKTREQSKDIFAEPLLTKSLTVS